MLVENALGSIRKNPLGYRGLHGLCSSGRAVDKSLLGSDM